MMGLPNVVNYVAVGASTAAYKRWEKAAIAGVSLVADAAEHLERTSTDKEVEHVQDATGELLLVRGVHLMLSIPSISICKGISF